MLGLSLYALAADPPPFHPVSIPHSGLVDGSSSTALISALASSGVVAIKGIPGYAALRSDILAATPACAATPAAAAHTFPDGTTRRTLATHSLPGAGGVQPLASAEGECAAFERAAAPFRALVAAATNLFAERLSSSLRARAPLLVAEDGTEFNSLHDVSTAGEHLEHFHAYTRATPSSHGPASPPTIDLHTDQGIFIAFTPALMVSATGEPDAAADAGRFEVGLADGSRAEAHFDPDSLVFLLGDGIHQVLPKDAAPRLRAAPHALSAPPTGAGGARAWYGRMVLPPKEAVIPASLSENRKTFGTLRAIMVEATLGGVEDPEAMSLGCSAPDLRPTHRELSACEAGTIFCWNRCMNTTEDRGVWYGVSDEICAEQGKQLQCTDVRGHIYNSSYDSHGDYNPNCVAPGAPHVNSDFPTLPGFPTDPEVCNQEAWDAFSATDGFEFSTALGPRGKLMWNVVEGEGGPAIESKMAYNGLFGYTSWGLRNNALGAGKNGMQGAWVAMALPGDDYTLTGGLNLSLPGSILPYQIDEVHSRFRYWKGSGQPDSAANQGRHGEPIPTVPDTLYNKSIHATGCFSSMSFTASVLGEEAITIDGSDNVIWAANVENAYVESHGRSNRGIVVIEWRTGATEFRDYPPPPLPAPPPPAPPAAPPSSGGGGLSAAAIGGIVGGVVGGLAVGLLAYYCGLKAGWFATAGDKTAAKGASYQPRQGTEQRM